MALTIDQFTCRSDNFGILIHDTDANVTASIDAPEFQPIVDHLSERGWNLDDILTTHHHADHVEANLTLKSAYLCTIIGPARDQIPGIDRKVKEGDSFTFGGYEVRVLDTPATRSTISAITCRPPGWRSSPTRCSPSAAGGCSRARPR